MNDSLVEFAFVSRHQPTPEQHALAREQGISLTHIGDHDAFTINCRAHTPGVRPVFDGFIHAAGPFEGVIVVHPAAALRLASQFLVGVYENASPRTNGCASLHIYDLRD